MEQVGYDTYCKLLDEVVKEMQGVKIEEEKELEEQSKIMQNSEKLQNSLNNIDIELNENAVTSISNSIRSLEKIEDCGAEYQNKLSELKDVYYTIQELARDISYMKEEIYFDEEERSNIENRLDTIYLSLIHI